MELQEFVSASLVGVMNGIEDAQRQLKDSTARIVPAMISFATHPATGDPSYGMAADRDDTSVLLMEFDVAVTASTMDERGAGGKVTVLAMSLGAEGRRESQNEVASRIKFRIPVLYPVQR